VTHTLQHAIAVSESVASHSHETPRISAGTDFALPFSADDAIVVVRSRERNAMTNDRLGAIEQTLQQIVAGQATTNSRLDTIDGRLDRMDGRLDVLDEKVQFLADAQVMAQEQMTKGFNGLREEFNNRLVPLETAVRRLSISAPAGNGRPATGRPRKRTPRR
jgi:hypothetical protein